MNKEDKIAALKSLDDTLREFRKKQLFDKLVKQSKNVTGAEAIVSDVVSAANDNDEDDAEHLERSRGEGGMAASTSSSGVSKLAAAKKNLIKRLGL